MEIILRISVYINFSVISKMFLKLTFEPPQQDNKLNLRSIMVFVSQFSQENEIFILTNQINPSLEESDRVVMPGFRNVAHILPNIVIGQISENILARIPPHAVIVVRIDPAKYHHRFPVGQEKGRFCDVFFRRSQSARAHFIPEQFK